MKRMMEYKGYTGTVEYSDAAECLWGRIAGINDIISYEGQSVAEIREAFREAVDCYLEDCEARGKSPDRPFSENVILRLEPELRIRLESQAMEAGISFNEFLTRKLASA